MGGLNARGDRICSIREKMYGVVEVEQRQTSIEVLQEEVGNSHSWQKKERRNHSNSEEHEEEEGGCMIDGHEDVLSCEVAYGKWWIARGIGSRSWVEWILTLPSVTVASGLLKCESAASPAMPAMS